jgi:hypothetical protein
MKLVDSPISKEEIEHMAKDGFGMFVKGVVDVEKRIIVLDAPLHADEEAYLLSLGSKQQHLWGINIYPELDTPDYIEFDSMINVRPSQQNLSRSVDDSSLQQLIREIVAELIP